MKRILFILTLMVASNWSVAQTPPNVPITVVNNTPRTFYIEFEAIYNCILRGYGPTQAFPATSTTTVPAPAGPSDWWYRVRIHDSNPPSGTCFNVEMKAPYWACTGEPSSIPSTMTCYGFLVTIDWMGPETAPVIIIS